MEIYQCWIKAQNWTASSAALDGYGNMDGDDKLTKKVFTCEC